MLSGNRQSYNRAIWRMWAAILLLLMAWSCILPDNGGGVAKAAKLLSLYAFGDSYADTGNHDSQNPKLWQPWKAPYGRKWPGSPSGRFSDGLVLTDFIAQFVNLPSPVPYRQVKSSSNGSNAQMARTGVNFAYGGSGVFDTYGPDYTNISGQIDQLEQFSRSTTIDFANSLALLVYGGNDYSIHLRDKGPRGLPFLITRVVGKISVELRRLHGLGFRKFAVTNLEPAGCLPFIAVAPRKNNNNNLRVGNCSRRDNVLSSLHNRLLAQSLLNLRMFRGRNSQYILLNQFESFLDVISSASTSGFSTDLLESCCQPTEKGAACGSIDSNGKPLYNLCPVAQKTLFWDGAHPSEAGWTAIAQNYKDLFDGLHD